MAGRNLRSRDAAANLKSTQPTSSSENTDSDSVVKGRMRQKRNILRDQTNTETSPLEASDEVEKQGQRRSARARKGKAKVATKGKKTTAKRKSDGSESDEGVKKIQVGERNTRTSSVKENDSEDEFVIKKRSRPVNKLQNSAATEKKKEPVEVSSGVKGNKTFNVSSFYGSPKQTQPSPVVVKSNTSPFSSPKICIYKTKVELPPSEKPKSEIERLALYEFEIDSSEEINTKKTKKKTRTLKQKPKTLKAQSKPTAKSATKPRVMLHGVKKVRTPRKIPSNSKVKLQVKHSGTAKPTNLEQPLNKSFSAVSPGPQNSPSTSKLMSRAIVKPSVAIKFPTSTKQTPNPPDLSPLSHPVVTPMAKQFSPPEHISVSPPPQAELPLEDLFEEQEESPFSKSMEVAPKLGPTRFDYEELVKARAKVKARRNRPIGNIVAQPKLTQSPSKSKETDSQEKPSLRQTSIRSFLGRNELPSTSQGLFSTGASVENEPHMMVSSTPQRQTGVKLLHMSPLLSPVIAKTDNRRQSPRKNNQADITQTLKMVEASSPLRKSPRKLSNSPAKFSSPPVSPAKVSLFMSTTPQKNTPSKAKSQKTPTKASAVVSASPEKVASPAKSKTPQKGLLAKALKTTSPSKGKDGPTRLSATTLLSILKKNAKSETAPPLMTADISDLPDEHESQVPESPQRTFHKPARKSYERRKVARPALNFMEIDQEEEERFERECEEGYEDSEDEEIPKTHKTIHRKQKQQPEEEKEFEKWASRFNSELEELEDFPLEVE